jgi:FkbM family methyltransferase
MKQEPLASPRTELVAHQQVRPGVPQPRQVTELVGGGEGPHAAGEGCAVPGGPQQEGRQRQQCPNDEDESNTPPRPRFDEWVLYGRAGMSVRDVASRIIDSSPVAGAVDRLGGWPVRLPSGQRTRVATRTRSLRLDREPELTAEFLNLLQPNELIVDAGAHWGLYTLMAGLAGCSVVAFEPSSSNRARLIWNIERAGLGARVDVRSEALWSNTGTLRFGDYGGDLWGRSMMAGIGSEVADSDRLVPTLTLDDLKVSPHIVKLDIEGAELAALHGASGTLRRARPTLLVEVHPSQLERLGDSVHSLKGLLTEAEYDVKELTPPPVCGSAPARHWLCQPRV